MTNKCGWETVSLLFR